MAAWQFDLYFIARDTSAPNMDAEGWDAPPLPLGLVYDVQTELTNYLGSPWMMLPHWLVFGPERGNRVDILFENEIEASVFVRCDVRDEAPQFLVLVSNLAHIHGCRFFLLKAESCSSQTWKCWRVQFDVAAQGYCPTNCFGGNSTD